MQRGYFISFEGVDGSGKSTQIEKLKSYLEEKGFQVILTREPGGTPISEKLRQVILDPENSGMTDMTEAMLYAASRAQLVTEVIQPALETGNIVICDRFVDSSIAYQAYGRGLGDAVGVINQYAIADCMPDLTILMKVKPDIGTKRIEDRARDRIELEEQSFHEAVYHGYEELERNNPERIVAIDAVRSIEIIHRDVVKAVESHLFSLG